MIHHKALWNAKSQNTLFSIAIVLISIATELAAYLPTLLTSFKSLCIMCAGLYLWNYKDGYKLFSTNEYKSYN